MKHRHLVDGVGFTSAAIDDILDRGKPKDWVELRDAVDADPWGKVAEWVLKICAAHYMYGTSELWLAYIEKLRSETTGDHVVTVETEPFSLLFRNEDLREQLRARAEAEHRSMNDLANDAIEAFLLTNT